MNIYHPSPINALATALILRLGFFLTHTTQGEWKKTGSFHIKISRLKGGDRRVRIFSAHNNWWATPEVSLPLPHQRSAKIILIFLRQGVKTMYYFKNMHSKSLKCAKWRIELDISKCTEPSCEYTWDEVPRVDSVPQKQSQTNRIALAPFGIIFHR